MFVPYCTHSVAVWWSRERHSQSKLAIQNSMECRLVGNNPPSPQTPFHTNFVKMKTDVLLAGTATLRGQQPVNNSAVSGWKTNMTQFWPTTDMANTNTITPIYFEQLGAHKIRNLLAPRIHFIGPGAHATIYSMGRGWKAAWASSWPQTSIMCTILCRRT